MSIKSLDINDGIRADARLLWDYHRLGLPLPTAVDLVLVAGSHDERVAEWGADLLQLVDARFVVAAGGLGKVTKQTQSVAEADRFKDIMVSRGVPAERVQTETSSTNMGENFVMTRELLAKQGHSIGTGLIVTKPYMERRALATGMAQWPGVEWQVTSPDIAFENYAREDVPEARMVHLMVGDLQRIRVYADRGLQVEQVIPSEVWSAYERLVAAGFDQHVMRD